MPPWKEFFDRLAQDLRYGIRMLIAKPGFTAVAVMSIALGIGASTAIFSVVYAVLIDPYPYRAADRIGFLSLTTKKDPQRGVPYTKAQYFDLKSRMRSMENAAAIDRNQVVMTGNGLAEVVVRGQCSQNFFDFFGVPVLMGRAFTQKEAKAGAAPEPVAVVSYWFWQRALQGRPDVLGQQIRLNDDLYTVIGVLPARFTWMDVDAYVPMDPHPGGMEDLRGYVSDSAGGERGSGERGVRADTSRSSAGTCRHYMYPQDAFKVKFFNVNEGILGKFQNTLLALFGAVALLVADRLRQRGEPAAGARGDARRGDGRARFHRRDAAAAGAAVADRERGAGSGRRSPSACCWRIWASRW